MYTASNRKLKEESTLMSHDIDSENDERADFNARANASSSTLVRDDENIPCVNLTMDEDTDDLDRPLLPKQTSDRRLKVAPILRISPTSKVIEHERTKMRKLTENLQPVQVNVQQSEKPPDAHYKFRSAIARGIRPKYNCDLCSTASFFLSGDLKKHMLDAHNEHRPHVCDICKKRFITEGRRNCHRQTHNYSAKELRCTLCGDIFNTNTGLAKHHLDSHTVILRNKRQFD